MRAGLLVTKCGLGSTVSEQLVLLEEPKSGKMECNWGHSA